MGIPSSLAFNSSGLSSFACIPKIIPSKSSVILPTSQPVISGSKPCLESLDLEGSKKPSSEPEMVLPCRCRAMARLCMTLPPIEMK